MKSPITAFFAATAISVCLLHAQPAIKVTSPKEALGFNLGDDYMVANYTQLETYWKKLATESPRMKLESIGKTEEGRDQWMAIVSSPENIKNLAKYKEIARKLALAEGVSEAEARALAGTESVTKAGRELQRRSCRTAIEGLRGNQGRRRSAVHDRETPPYGRISADLHP